MRAVTFYFDPACPFAWAASRWLVNTAQRRDIEIDWRQMSLAVLNEGADVPEQQRHHIEVSQQLGRVLAAAHDRAGDSALGPLYTALGQRVHQQGADVTTAVVAQALTESGLDPQLADSLDDSTYDSAVRVAHQQSQDSLGDSGGSPIVCIDGSASSGQYSQPFPTTTTTTGTSCSTRYRRCRQQAPSHNCNDHTADHQRLAPKGDPLNPVSAERNLRGPLVECVDNVGVIADDRVRRHRRNPATLS
jgi:2-hydroxychromene-2-carboxylate isomerase